jgi:hypothetical protein
MYFKTIDENILPLFKSLEEVGIILEEEKLINLIRGLQKRLAEQKQMINREVGFIVNLYSEDHWSRVMGGVGAKDSLLHEKLIESRKVSSLIRKLQQVYTLASGNSRVLGRQFGIYTKYGLDSRGKIIPVGELSLEDFPEEVLGAVSYHGKILVKATYSDIIMDVTRKLSHDSGVDVESFINGLANLQSVVRSFFGRRGRLPRVESERVRFSVEFPIESTAMDLAKIGFISLFEDYRIGKLGSQIFAVAPYSVYLSTPYDQVDSILSIARECLENTHSDFTLSVDVKIGNSLNGLV